MNFETSNSTVRRASLLYDILIHEDNRSINTVSGWLSLHLSLHCRVDEFSPLLHASNAPRSTTAFRAASTVLLSRFKKWKTGYSAFLCLFGAAA
jgi:hypothetical protein